MPIAGHLTKIVWGGKLAVTESWSCSIHHLDPVAPLTDLAAIHALCTTWFTDGESKLNGLATLEYVKANEIAPATGLYLNSVSNDLFFDPETTFNPATGRSAPQLSICITTRASIDRGRGHAGRFYPPSAHPSMAVGGTVADSLVFTLANAKALLEGFNGLQAGQCVIYSKVGQVANFITRIAIGSVVDTQRRRRKSIVEAYVTDTVDKV